MPKAILECKINGGRLWKVSHNWTDRDMFLSLTRDDQATALIKAICFYTHYTQKVG